MKILSIILSKGNRLKGLERSGKVAVSKLSARPILPRKRRRKDQTFHFWLLKMKTVGIILRGGNSSAGPVESVCGWNRGTPLKKENCFLWAVIF